MFSYQELYRKTNKPQKFTAIKPRTICFYKSVLAADDADKAIVTLKEKNSSWFFPV